jgi:NADH-quinone oxidoreductase subunit G
MSEEKKPHESNQANAADVKPAAPAGAPGAVVVPAQPAAAATATVVLPSGGPPKPAIDLPKAPEGQMTLRVNGKDHFVDPKKYRTLIAALHDLGYDVPHFCYHPGLEPDGNCRMCYVNQTDVMSGKPVMTMNLAHQPFQPYPKPIISCREPLNPRGMVIETETEEVKKARALVMEFLLINHPLDCPVCDKAGECTLQNNSFEHGNAGSRFEEKKNEKAPKELGFENQPHGIKLWTDRCITCTRCTRFLDEVSGTSELYVVNRGDRSEIDIVPVDNPLMGNIVDICPVGALIDSSLMFTYRAWYLQKTNSICPGCAQGCNIEVQTQKEYVRRLQPRENVDVNGWWMSDEGRHDFHYINSKNRVLLVRSNGQASMDVQGTAYKAGEKLKEYAKKDPNSVAGIVSAWLTLEELHTFKSLFADALGSIQVGLIAQKDGKEQIFPKFKIYSDKNPNRAGAKLVFGADVEKNTQAIIDGINSGKIKALYLVNSMPHYVPSEDLLKALKKVEYLVVQDMLNGPLTEIAHVVLPGSSYAEKDGVFVNVNNRAQVVRRAIDPLGHGHDDLALLQRVLRAAGQMDAKLVSAREVFRRMSEIYPDLQGLTHQTLGKKGLVIGKKEAAAAGE